MADASNVTFYDRSQASKTTARVAEMPNFHAELRSMEVFDGQNVHLEAKFSPADDPNVKIVWLFNGNPLKQSKLEYIIIFGVFNCKCKSKF